jgi:hypothetical protein
VLEFLTTQALLFFSPFAAPKCGRPVSCRAQIKYLCAPIFMKSFSQAIVLLFACIAIASASSCSPSSFKLMAGQSIEVGSVSISNSESAIEVKLQVLNGWTMSEVHVYAGNSAPETVAPGQFPFSRTLANPTDSFTALVPLVCASVSATRSRTSRQSPHFFGRNFLTTTPFVHTAKWF